MAPEDGFRMHHSGHMTTALHFVHLVEPVQRKREQGWQMQEVLAAGRDARTHLLNMTTLVGQMELVVHEVAGKDLQPEMEAEMEVQRQEYHGRMEFVGQGQRIWGPLAHLKEQQR